MNEDEKWPRLLVRFATQKQTKNEHKAVGAVYLKVNWKHPYKLRKPKIKLALVRKLKCQYFVV